MKWNLRMVAAQRDIWRPTQLQTRPHTGLRGRGRPQEARPCDQLLLPAGSGSERRSVGPPNGRTRVRLARSQTPSVLRKVSS